MKILSITSLLPIDNIIKTNDFIFELYSYYLKKYSNDSVLIIKPVKYSNFITKTLGQNSYYDKVKNSINIVQNSFTIYFFKFLSFYTKKNLHALLSISIFYLNKKRLYKIIKQNNIDVVHAEYIFPDGMLAYYIKRRLNIPYIVTTHREMNYFNYWISNIFAHRVLRNASFITPLNYYNKGILNSRNLHNVNVVPHGIYEKGLLIKKEYRKDNIVKILTIGELISIKNIDKVIIALSNLKKYKKKYTIIGRGPEKENLMKLSIKHGLEKQVNFIDYIPHEKIYNEIAKHDIFILCSYPESFGRVYFESMSLGLPVICSKNSGIHGYFTEMEEAISVNPTNIDEIKNKLELLIGNSKLREKVGENGKKLVRKFTWDKVAEIFHHYYQKATNNKYL